MLNSTVNLALRIIWTVFLNSDGDELSIVDCTGLDSDQRYYLKYLTYHADVWIVFNSTFVAPYKPGSSMSIVRLLGKESCLLKVPLSGRLLRLLSGLNGRAGVIYNGKADELVAQQSITIVFAMHC